MAKIDTIWIKVNGVKTAFLIMDKETALSLVDATARIAVLAKNDTAQNESIANVQDAIKKISQKDVETDQTLKSHDERITAANGTADSAVKKYTALSGVVGDNTKKITDEVERAKEVEGYLDQLATTPKDNLVAAINWVLTKADKGLENVGTLTDLTTTEKTDLVKAVNEVVKNLASTDKKAEDAVKKVENVTDVGIATESKAGIVKPDGATISVTEDGTIKAASVTFDEATGDLYTEL